MSRRHRIAASLATLAAATTLSLAATGTASAFPEEDPGAGLVNTGDILSDSYAALVQQQSILELAQENYEDAIEDAVEEVPENGEFTGPVFLTGSSDG